MLTIADYKNWALNDQRSAVVLNDGGDALMTEKTRLDRVTYDSLMELKHGQARRKEYLDSIRPRLSPASYAAAESRLDDVIAHAEKLKKENKVINKEGWLEVQEEPLATGKVEVKKQNGAIKRLGGQIARDVNGFFCPSYFARDGLAKLFA